MLEFLANHITLYDLIFQAIVVFAVSPFIKDQRPSLKIPLYFILLSTAINPLILSFIFYIIFNYLVVALFIFYDQRQLDRAILLANLVYMNLYCQDLYYFSVIYPNFSSQSWSHYLLWVSGSLLLITGLTYFEKYLWQNYIAGSEKRTTWMLLATSLLTLIIFIPTFYREFLTFSGSNRMALIFLLISNLGLAIFLIIGVVLYYLGTSRIKQAERQQAQQKINQDYQKLINQQYEELRAFRHDWANIMTGLQGLVDQQRYPDLADYLNDLNQTAPNSRLNQDLPVSQLNRLTYSSLSNLFYTKLYQAQRQGIQCALEIQDPLYQGPINQLPLTRMLGILLDNAIEELGKLDQGQLVISLAGDQVLLNISIANQCQNIQASLDQVKKPGHSTKGPGRSQGLANLHELAHGQGIQIFTYNQDDFLIQELVIPFQTKKISRSPN
ncbi:hypothetical protein AWM75_05450 [Aerococcus urinaehominis]|uniref:Sensor histidine kinase NatK-like C-terminal domain-containing protein n=1 Tax=Aerococcus urinaehominis TaxID=128944 RepID=A0A120IAX7_9LACT|nr:GHKL domain-containing protein [Aerococcus urinaehominis]AMB99473.1 hypothetical protein AWM75_05450 [Aerococcus urinaehominis]SDM27193.1 GHKL domain-containing protein [Aerococcus urinaehominis]